MEQYKHVQIELTNACNLSCVECPHVNMERALREMPKDLFELVLDKLVVGKNVETIILHKDGEPLLYRHLRYAMALIAARCPNTKIDLYTNGLLLTREFFEFLGTIPNRICLLISFHLYNADGSKNDYSKVNDLIETVAHWPLPHVQMVIVSHKTKLVSYEELSAWHFGWMTSPVAWRFNGGIHINNCVNTWAGKVPDGNTSHTSCPYGDAAHLFVGNTGNILACCVDLEEEIVFGNVQDKDLTSALRAREDHFKALSAAPPTQPICIRCTTPVKEDK